MSKHTLDSPSQRITPVPESGFDLSEGRSEFGEVGPLADHEAVDHFALFYDDQAEQFATAIPFIKDGIEHGERCVYVADDNTVDDVLDAMRAYGIDVDTALDSGILSVHTEEEVYSRTGEFDREAVMDFWKETFTDATDGEYTGLRAAAEMTWALDADDTDLDQLCEYEELLNPLYDGEEYAVLCQYNRDRFPADVLHDVLETHPYLIYDATVCENLYYTPPEKYFGPDQPSREFDRKLATLVDRTETRTTLQTQTRFQQRLYGIVSRPGSFEEKLQAVFELGCEWFDLDLGGVAKVDPETDFFEIEAVSGEHDYLVPGARVDLSETYCRVIADEGAGNAVPDPVAITAPESDNFSDEACVSEFGQDTYLGTRIPVVGDYDRTFFFVAEEPRDRAFTDTERTFHRLMGQWVRYELERRQRERFLQECYEITADPARSFEAKLDALIDLGCEQLGLEYGGLAQIDPERDLFEVEKINGEHDYLSPGEQYPLSETYCQLATDDGETAALTDPVEAGFEGKLCYEQFGVQAYLGTHLPVEGDIDRTFWFVSNEPVDRPITDTEQTFVDLMGQWVQYELERRQREEALRERTEHLNALIETTPECIKTVAPDGTLLQMNPAGLEMVEAPAESAVTGESVYDLIAPADRERFREFNERVCSGESGTLEFDVIGLDGTRRHMESHAAPLERPDGTTVHVALTRDVTEQKEREAELRQTKDRFETVFEQSDDGIFIIDPDADELVDANPAAAEMLGYTRDELLSLTPSDLHPTELEQFHAFLDEARESGSAWSEDLHCRHRSGHDIPAEVTASTVTLDGRELVLANVRHISERKKHERYQRDLYEIAADTDCSPEEKLERLLELGRDRFGLEMGGLNHLPSWDGEFRLEKGVGLGLDDSEELWTDPGNDCYCRRTVSADEPVAMADVRDTHWVEDPIYQEFGMTSYLGTKVSCGSTPYGTLWFGSTEPRENPFSAAERSFVELMGQWAGYEIERRQYEQELEETIERLQQSNERLEQFAYAASHDLQEPLRMVTSYLQLLEKRYGDAFDEEGEEFLDFAVDGAERMREMIDALLEYSRVDRRGTPLEPVELDDVLDDVLDDLQVEIEEHDADITTESLPRVEGDESQLRQVFQNLLDNSMTYNGDESPEIRVDADYRAHEQEWVISVHDNGIGIDPDDQDQIFTVFDRLHSRDEYEGTGIGLALCQRIIERHGGEIWVESEPGEGSTFSLTLPAAQE